MHTGLVCLLGALAAAACRPATATSAPAGTAPAEPPVEMPTGVPADTVGEGSPAGADPRAPRLDPLPAPPPVDPAPQVTVEQPAMDVVLTPAEVEAVPLGIRVASWSVAPEEGGIDVVLDRYRPMRLSDLGPSPKLGDLVPEDQNLAPGEHLLFVVAVTADGRGVRPVVGSAPYALSRFWVGTGAGPKTDLSRPMIVQLQPRGTYNGVDRAEAAFLEFYLINTTLGAGRAVLATVSGAEGRQSRRLEAWRPHALRELESGDYDVEVMLVDERSAPLPSRWATAQATITVNRDAPVQETP